MKILVFIDQYESGGAARVTSTMINGLTDNGYEVILATNISSRSLFYPLDKKIKIIDFYGGETHNKIQSVLRHVRLILSAKKCVAHVRPNVIVAVTHNPYMYVRIATWNSKIPLIAVDHTSFSRKISRREDWVRNNFYKYANVLSILTEKDRKILGDRLPNKTVIYNPLSFSPLDTESKRKKNILVAGRLSFWQVKGIDRIIKIWANIHSKYPEWKLEIAGDGDVKSIDYLKQLAFNGNLGDSIDFLGQVSDMRTKLSQTSIFALTSRVEGFPMVLMEAMSQGCACVAFSLGGACEEMLTSGVSGLIIQDDDLNAFSNALESLLQKENIRNALGHEAIERSKCFSVDRFINKWTQILSQYEIV